MSPKYSQKTGDVFIRNFDEGVANRIGAVATIGNRRGYWVDIVGATPLKVPIIWMNPEQVYEDKIYPCILINRDAVEPAFQRWHSVRQLEYVAGVSGTESTVIVGGVSGSSGIVGGRTVSGYDQVVVKGQAYPYDLFYTISVYARYEHEALPMIKYVLRRFPQYSRISVIDSLGESRGYSTFGESGIQDLSEIVDVADRVRAYAISFRVEGELDLEDPIVQSTVIEFETSVEKT